MTGGRRARSRRRGDKGGITLEIAVLTPAVMAILGLGIAGGRYEVAAGAVEASSAAAARAASLARSPQAAEQAAKTAAAAMLDGEDLHCAELTVTVDVADFARVGHVDAGPPAQVGATVTCRLDLGELFVPAVPGTWTISGRSTSVLDTYRSTT